MTGENTYDALPYRSRAIHEVHPNRSASMAILYGLDPPPVERCRVLDIGCAEGGNALAIATSLPAATVVGVDLSERQIAMGRERIRAIGLTNVELLCADFTRLPPDLGTFDYVFTHGLYSWIPVPLQQALLETCRRLLSPRGIAYVSYNVYPGWKIRSILREVALFRARLESEPAAKVAAAKEFLRTITAAAHSEDDTLQGLLAKEVEHILKESPDEYIFHEYLEEENNPCWFHEFAAKAAAAGLTYVCDARMGANPIPALHGEMDEPLRAASRGRLDREQCVDFVAKRVFRQSLLCRDSVAVLEDPDLLEADRLQAFTLARPEPGTVDGAPGVAVAFESPKGARLTTDDPLTKAALAMLWARYPEPVPVSELLARSASGEGRDPEGEARLRIALLKAASTGFLDLVPYVPPFVARPGERPSASPLGRLQSGLADSEVTTLLHRNLAMEDRLARVVLGLCDGTRDRGAILDEAAATILARGFMKFPTGETVTDPALVRTEVGKALPGVLDGLARNALFTA